MQPDGAGTAVSDAGRIVAMEGQDRSVTGRRDREARAVGPERERGGSRQQRRGAAVGDALSDAPGDAGRLHEQAGRIALQERDRVAGRGDVDVAPARGDRDRRRAVRAHGPWRTRGRRRAGCSRSARAAARARPWWRRAAAPRRRWRPWRRRRAWRRPARSRARRRPPGHDRRGTSPASAPPRTQAWRPPSWSSAPPVASSEKDATASASRPATYRLRPSGAIASEVAPSRPTPEAQPPPPPGRTQPAAPRSCVSAPVLTSRANAVTEPVMDETA